MIDQGASNIYAYLYLDEQVVEDLNVTIFNSSEYTTGKLTGTGTFASSNISANTTYILTITNKDGEPFNSMEVTTLEAPTSEFEFDENYMNVTDSEVAFKYSVNPEYVHYVEGEALPDLYVEITKKETGDVITEGVDQDNLELLNSKLVCTDSVIGLEESTLYVLAIKYNDGKNVIELGATEFETAARETGFKFLDDQIVATYDSITFAFEINESIIQESTIYAGLYDGNESKIGRASCRERV